jgi:hypothetical protein
VQVRNNLDETAIRSLISHALQNALCATGKKIGPLAPESRLIGADAIIDSTAFVAFVVDLENQLADAFGMGILLTEAPDAFENDGPFRSIAALTVNIQKCLSQGG